MDLPSVQCSICNSAFLSKRLLTMPMWSAVTFIMVTRGSYSSINIRYREGLTHKCLANHNVEDRLGVVGLRSWRRQAQATPDAHLTMRLLVCYILREDFHFLFGIIDRRREENSTRKTFACEFKQ